MAVPGGYVHQRLDVVCHGVTDGSVACAINQLLYLMHALSLG